MSLSFALLGLLNYAPMTGYDLKKFFNDSINFFWSAQTSQIYRELKAWEDKGCITSVVQPGDKGPDKRVYSITEQGVSRFKDWLGDIPESIDEDNRNAFLLRIFLLSQAGRDELIFHIQKRLRKYKSDYQKLKAVEGRVREYARMLDKDGQIPYWRIVLSRGYHDVESHIRWAEESLEYLGNLPEDNQDTK